MKGQLKEFIQTSLNRVGLQIRRVDQGVSYTDPYVEQVRLLQDRQVNTVFEVGAADGRDALSYAALFPHARIFAFEPVPASFQKLKEVVQKEQRISAINMAVSDTVGTAKFNLAEWNDASSLFSANKTGSTFDEYNQSRTNIQVQTESIDHFCQAYKIDNINLLKMDAQGAEFDILNGAETMLKEGRIDLIYTEVNFMEIYKGAKSYDEIAGYLRKYGFHLHNLYGLATNQKGQLAWGDAIFVREKLIEETILLQAD
jgi:FkbM family methyltransferase